MKVKNEFYAIMGKEITLVETEKEAIEEFKKLNDPKKFLWIVDLREKQIKEFDWKKLAMALIK